MLIEELPPSQIVVEPLTEAVGRESTLTVWLPVKSPPVEVQLASDSVATE